MDSNDGGTAFPADRAEKVPLCANDDGTITTVWQNVSYSGMSLRDWFAGQAIVDASLGSANYSPETYLGLARNAYRLADAMLEARK